MRPAGESKPVPAEQVLDDLMARAHVGRHESALINPLTDALRTVTQERDAALGEVEARKEVDRRTMALLEDVTRERDALRAATLELVRASKALICDYQEERGIWWDSFRSALDGAARAALGETP